MTRRLFLVCFAMAISSAPCWADGPHWVVVTAPAFRSALEPLCAHRQAEGMRITILQTTEVLTPAEIRAGDASRLVEHVWQHMRQTQGPCYVLLVGAVTDCGLEEPETKIVPALNGTVSRMRGQPSDNGYGCPQGGLLPTVPVGRLPARSVEEVQAMVRKTLAYERQPPLGLWKQHITVLAGVPAFNPVVDRLVETLALSRFAQLDGRWTVRALYHNPGSRFCVPDRWLHERARQYVEEGQAVTLYLGHSWAHGFYAPQTRYLDRDDWASLKIQQGPGIFAIFGCNGCQLGGPNGEGYGLAAMRNPHGPVAVLGSHGICFAAMCQLAADGLLRGVRGGQMPERLADVWLALKQGIAHGKIDPVTFRLLDAADGDPRIPPDLQRWEHLEMFVLLGDPALRLPRLPEGIRLEVEGRLAPGGIVRVTGQLPPMFAYGTVRLTLERPLTSQPTNLKPVPAGSAAQRETVLLANHESANQFVLSEQTLAIRQGRFLAVFDLPDRLPWSSLILRAYAVSGSQEIVGVERLPVTN